LKKKLTNQKLNFFNFKLKKAPPVFTEIELNNDLNSDLYSQMALASSLPNSKKMNSQTYYNHLQAQQQDLDASTKSVQVVEGRPLTLGNNSCSFR
jgi:hypothetical protein